MEFLIEQFDDRFELSKKGDSRILLSGNRSMLGGNNTAELFDRNQKLLFSVKQKFSLWKWKMSYLIKNKNGQEFVLHSTNYWHSIYELSKSENVFLLKLHKGRKKSVFKNGNQIAEIDESFVEVFFQNKIRITTKEHQNLEEIFLMIVCMKIGDENSSGVSFKFGNLGRTEPIDQNWREDRKR